MVTKTAEHALLYRRALWEPVVPTTSIMGTVEEQNLVECIVAMVNYFASWRG